MMTGTWIDGVLFVGLVLGGFVLAVHIISRY